MRDPVARSPQRRRAALGRVTRRAGMSPSPEMLLAVSELRRRTVRKRSWHAWTGTLDEVRGIGRVVEQLYDSTKDDDGSGRVDDAAFYVDKLICETTVWHGGDSVTGVLDSALAELDRRTVTAVMFRVKPAYGDDRLCVELRWGQTPAIRLSISTPDPGWANQALAALSAEIDKGAPRWAWVQSSWGRTFVWVLASVAVLFPIEFISPVVTPFWIPPLAALTMTLPLRFSDRMYAWLFPPIEIVGEGLRSTGSRRFVFAGSLLLTFAIGIMINLVTSHP